MEQTPTPEWPRQEALDALALEIREEIGRIDFTVLHDIFAEYARRSGIDPEATHFQNREEVKILARGRTSAMGNYTIRDGVQINVSGVHKMLESSGEPTSPLLRRVLFHEETHASGHQESCTYEEIAAYLSTPRDERGALVEDQGGYRKNIFDTNGRSILFRLFNEGVTDLIAEEVYAEYHKRVGDPVLHPFVRGYKGEPQRMVQAITRTISEESNIPPYVVWESLIQGYFTGLDLGEEEIQRLFSETFGIDLIKAIERIKESSEIAEVVEDIETRDRSS